MTTEYSPMITLGNLINTVVVVAGGALAFGILNGRVDANVKKIDESMTAIMSQDARLRVLETASARADERMTNIIELFNRIDARLARIEENRR